MKSIREFQKTGIQYLFTDIDDTITTDGLLPSESYSALWKLHQNGIQVIPVTGRPAGWCEMIARFWPVAGVIGENGALAFRHADKKMHRWFSMSEAKRLDSQRKLKVIEAEILKTVPGCAVSSDQFCRLFDLAIDFSEDVPPLPETQVKKIKEIFERHGATAKISSIHVNGWFGQFDKLSMCQEFYKTLSGQSLKDSQESCVFVGDSPNDEPMFGFFKNSVAVANIKKFEHLLKQKPSFICSKESGEGFVEFVDLLLA